MKVESKALETQVTKGFSILRATSKPNLVQLEFFTPELAVESKSMISPDKESTFKEPIQMLKLSPILDQDSTLKGKDFSPYWTDLCKAISSKLWLPTKTDLQGLGSTLSNIWSNITVENSWFLTTLHQTQRESLSKIFSPSLDSSVQELMDSESIITKSRKIRIYLTYKQERIVEKWFGVARWVYNYTVEYLKQEGTKASWMAIKKEILDSLPEWCKEVPFQIKSMAIKDACQAVKIAKKKFKETGKFNTVRFKSRKQPSQSCYIPKSAVKDRGIFVRILGLLRYKEQLPDNIMDSRLVRQHGRYYIAIPFQESRTIGENQARVVALDPGVRTFNTFFSENSCGWLGQDANLVIQKLCLKLDNLISRMSKASKKRQARMNKAAHRLRHRIQSKVKELHHKVARFLVDNFDIILLPTFETSQMSKKLKRRIRAKSVRQMLTLSHYQFKAFLKHKAFETGKMVIDVCEAYTSKTVSWTGEMVNVGGSKTITSKQDGHTMDRDINGARGIFLRALVDTPLLNNNLL